MVEVRPLLPNRQHAPRTTTTPKLFAQAIAGHPTTGGDDLITGIADSRVGDGGRGRHSPARYCCCAVGAGDMDGGAAGPGPCASELSTHGAGQSPTTIEYEMRRLHDVVVTSFQHRETPDECSRITHAEPRDTERHPADRRGGKRPGSAAEGAPSNRYRRRDCLAPIWARRAHAPGIFLMPRSE
jgi:hypothetical protein